MTHGITVLGGGPAGLAVGYFARKKGLPCTVFEAGPRIGGNCRTLRHGEFRYDSGAHRLHDQDCEVTRELKSLMGDELRDLHVPSLIFSEGKFIDFPLSPLNLGRSLGPITFGRAGLEVLGARLRARGAVADFESFALRTYGPTLARRLLLNYSEKLWGAPGRQLSLRVAGKRMKGLTLKTFIKEAIHGHAAKTEHLDGGFCYPRHGIGAICDALGAACGPRSIRRNSRITGVRHERGRIVAVEVNRSQTVPVPGQVVSALPLDRFLGMMTPSPPSDLLSTASALHYRHVVLLAAFLNRATVTDAATLYFPGSEFPFTRVYEPRNRSPELSPPGKTSLVIEIPCKVKDPVWAMGEDELAGRVLPMLIRIGLMEEAEVMDYTLARMSCAYPVLEVGFEDKLGRVLDYLGRFENLSLSGRCGRFAYLHLHDLMRSGKEIVDELETPRLPPPLGGHGLTPGHREPTLIPGFEFDRSIPH